MVNSSKDVNGLLQVILERGQALSELSIRNEPLFACSRVGEGSMLMTPAENVDAFNKTCVVCSTSAADEMVSFAGCLADTVTYHALHCDMDCWTRILD